MDNNNCINYFEDQDLKDAIIKEMDIFGRQNGLKGFELPKKYTYSRINFLLKIKLLLLL